MRRGCGRIAGLAALAALTIGATAAAQTSPPQSGPPPASYRPGLGDLMAATIQPRHVKLALAGRQKNWPLAAFELGQMEESFERVGRIWPTWRSISIADMVDVVKEPMAALRDAIRARDADRFAAAYGRLTDACNSCHIGANRGMVVIVAPRAAGPQAGGAYPDQEFAPKTR